MISNRIARDRARMWVALALFAVATAGAALSAQNPAPSASPAPAQQTFTMKAASPMILQVSDGLQTRNARRMLAPFDMSVMPDGPLFQQQLLSFFSHTETIRVHLNLVNATSDQEQGTAEVDAEMEADLGDNTVPLHKQARLKFSAAVIGGAWKFVDVQPRSFFSTQP